MQMQMQTQHMQHEHSNAVAVAAPVPRCHSCSTLIHERYYLQAMEKTWHTHCLRCVDCKISMDSQHSCFVRDGLIFCKEDYFR